MRRAGEGLVRVASPHPLGESIAVTGHIEIGNSNDWVYVTTSENESCYPRERVFWIEWKKP